MKFTDIKQYPYSAYQVNVQWGYLKEHLESWMGSEGLIMQPDFQRGHVWSEFQQISYCENMMRNPMGGKDIFFNNPSWMGKFDQPTECVDGQQRVAAVLAFLNDEIKCFGQLCSEFDRLRMCSGEFIFHVLKIEDRRELIQFYIDMNTGGSIHTEEDLAPAYEELEKLNKI